MYGCLRDFDFLKAKIHCMDPYFKFLEQYKKSPFQIGEVGSCFGTDARRLVLDGVKDEHITVFDVEDSFFKMGYELYQDQEKFKPNTVFKSLTDNDFNADGKLNNKFKVVYAGAVLHCLSIDEVDTLVTRVLEMMEPNGVFYGWTVGANPPAEWVKCLTGDKRKYLHSPDSLKEVLEKVGYVQVITNTAPEKKGGRKYHYEMPGVNQIYMGFIARKPCAES